MSAWEIDFGSDRPATSRQRKGAILVCLWVGACLAVSVLKVGGAI